MKKRKILNNGRMMAVAFSCLLIGASVVSSCSDDLLTGQPEWLGNSIYERLQEDGNYQTTLRLIDDLGQTEVLSRTGSKTLFVADDNSYAEWFRTNKWGVRSYEQLSESQKKLLLNNSMVNNAYLIELLSNLSGNPPQEGMCMRRATAVSEFDSVSVLLPSQMPNTHVWDKHREKKNGILILKDATASPMIHFMPAFMHTNQITDQDLAILTNGESNSVSDAWVNGKKVIERDITCKNGYIQKVSGVIESSSNIAEILRQHPNMSLWSHLIDRYSAPYYSEPASRSWYEKTGRLDSVYVLRYYSNISSGRARLQTDPDDEAVEATLTYDPGWNQYFNYNATTNQGISNDAAVMIVPNNQALEYWWDHDGKVLQDEYHEWDSIPDLVLAELLNVNMLNSFTSSVPSKFGSILNDAKMEMGVKPEHIDSCFMGCNGVVYLSNHVFAPSAYSSVSFPALIHQDVMSIIYWAITQYDFSPYLNSMESYYSFFIPTNNAMLYYIDPTTYGEPIQTLYEFYWDPKAVLDSRVKARRYQIIIDPETGNYTVGSPLGNAPQAQIRNRLTDLLDMLIVVGDVESGQQYYKTKGGSVVKVTDAGQPWRMTVSGGYQMETGNPLTVSTIYDQSTSGNGKSYVTNDGMILGASKSVYATLKEHEQMSLFLDLLSGNDEDSTKYNLLITQDGNYKCVNPTNNYNIRLFDKFNYTVYVPTNESIQQLIDEGYLPTWDDYEAQTLEAWNDDDAKVRAARAAIRNRIFNFVRYHIQDNAVYIGCDPVNNTKFETAKLNPENQRFFSLEVNAGPSALTVTDQLGNTRHVITNNGLYNKICREYWFSGSGNNMSINSASDAVVHLIDGVLLFNNDLKAKTWQQELNEIRNQSNRP